MSASLAIVAHAPLVAAASGWCSPILFPPMTCLTASYVAKYTACAGPTSPSSAVRPGVVEGAPRNRTGSYYDARHAAPQAQDSLAGRHAIRPLDNTIVDGRRGGVDDLHACLRVAPGVSEPDSAADNWMDTTDLDRINWVHYPRLAVFQAGRRALRVAWAPPRCAGRDSLAQCSAMPAKAPAAMFWTREKLGGRLS